MARHYVNTGDGPRPKAWARHRVRTLAAWNIVNVDEVPRTARHWREEEETARGTRAVDDDGSRARFSGLEGGASSRG